MFMKFAGYKLSGTLQYIGSSKDCKKIDFNQEKNSKVLGTVCKIQEFVKITYISFSRILQYLGSSKVCRKTIFWKITSNVAWHLVKVAVIWDLAKIAIIRIWSRLASRKVCKIWDLVKIARTEIYASLRIWERLQFQRFDAITGRNP